MPGSYLAVGSPAPGARMPAEFEPHEQTLIAFPTQTRAETLWHAQLATARLVHTGVAAVIAPVCPPPAPLFAIKAAGLGGEVGPFKKAG